MARNERIDIIVGARDQTNGVLGNIQKQIIGLGTAYLSFRTVKTLIQDTIKFGTESEKVWTQVASSLKRHKIATDGNLQSIKDFTARLMEMSGVADESFAKGIQLFLDYNQSLDQAKRSMMVALDFAKGAGIELSSAIDLLSKAGVGYTATLSRYGIIIDENIPKSEKFAAAMQQINDRFGGSAASAINDTSTAIDGLTENVGEFFEALYKIATPEIKASSSWLRDTLKESISALDELANMRAGDITFIELLTVQFLAFTDQSEKAMAILNKFDSNYKRISAEEAIRPLIPKPLIDEYVDTTIPRIERRTTEYAEVATDQFNRVMANFKMLCVGMSWDSTNLYNELTNNTNKWAANDVKMFDFQMQRLHEMTKEQKEESNSLADQITFSAKRMSSALVDAMFGAKVSMKDIWKSMASDFIKYFLDKAITAMMGPAGFIGKFLKALHLFDNPVNDRMAAQMGYDFSSFFAQGMLNRQNAFNAAGVLANTSFVNIGRSYLGTGFRAEPHLQQMNKQSFQNAFYDAMKGFDIPRMSSRDQSMWLKELQGVYYMKGQAGLQKYFDAYKTMWGNAKGPGPAVYNFNGVVSEDFLQRKAFPGLVKAAGFGQVQIPVGMWDRSYPGSSVFRK